MVPQSKVARVLKSVPFWVVVGIVSVFAVLAVVLVQVTTDRGPAEEYDYPIAYRPAMDPDSLAPPQSIELREGGGALLTNVLVGELVKDGSGGQCVRPSGKPFSGAASWTLDARGGSFHIQTEAGEASFLAVNGRMVALDWSEVEQFVCSRGEVVYVLLNDLK